LAPAWSAKTRTSPTLPIAVYWLSTFVHVRTPNLSNPELLLRLDRALPDIVSAIDRKARIVEIR
jgi:hypothetical protein